MLYRRFGSFIVHLVLIHSAARLAAQEGSILPPAPTPTDVKPGSITCDECPYPYPSKYLDLKVYTQDVRIAYMDVAPQGTANGRTVVLLHGNNFGGFYFKPVCRRSSHFSNRGWRRSRTVRSPQQVHPAERCGGENVGLACVVQHHLCQVEEVLR